MFKRNLQDLLAELLEIEDVLNQIEGRVMLVEEYRKMILEEIMALSEVPDR